MKSILDFYKMKANGTKIVMATCYDYSAAKIVEEAGIDCVLVGDSVAMVVHGNSNTINATLDMMVMHTKAVANGLKNTFIIADLPFLSYRYSLDKSMHAVEALIKAGANCVKLEGVRGNEKLIKHIVESGVPVMGHLGLTPQHLHQLGGFKVQGKEESAAKIILEQAKMCEELGCFAVVLECIPSKLAKEITQALNIATIGIGAGADTDGQVLVYHDLLGLISDVNYHFAKRYINGNDILTGALKNFVAEVKSLKFPTKENSF